MYATKKYIHVQNCEISLSYTIFIVFRLQLTREHLGEQIRLEKSNKHRVLKKGTGQITR